ncbi:MAG TPA: prepilin-type N-terminal cleavage/methylation domain-containing protein [Candidatus Aminicenantes bacterium]|nr:prepilin-type N-terminal cleavage/methylation domain-containing protein [Candidatus Aminicenantes bacterium]
MNRGFSLMELLIALSLSLGVLTMVVSSVSHTVRVSRRFGEDQQRLEAIFLAIDTLRADIENCGMRLQEPFALGFPIVTCAEDNTQCSLLTGRDDAFVIVPAATGASMVRVTPLTGVAAKDSVLIFEPFSRLCVANRLTQVAVAGEETHLSLADPLLQPIPAAATLVALRRVEYRWFAGERVLKRKADRGTFQPLLEGVTDFFFAYFPEDHTVLYRIEVDRREQLRGFLFLSNVRGT